MLTPTTDVGSALKDRAVVLLSLAVALASGSFAGAEGPARKFQVVTPKGDGIIATGINGRGDVVGFEWVEEEDHPGVISQVPFYARGKEMTYLPVIEGYTATFPAAVSDDGLVVGRAGKPAPRRGRVSMRNQAFVWDAGTGIRGLGVLEGDTASFACGVTRDGRRISGFSVGEGRVRACLWDRDGEGWKGMALPQASPKLGSNVVAVSDNGIFVAAVDGVLPCLWRQDDSGRWTREVIGEAGSLVPRAVNNAGTVVGLRFDDDGSYHAVLRGRERGHVQLEEPQGYTRSEATAVNNEGVVVGMVDGPRGSKVGPDAFVFVPGEGRPRLLHEGGPAFTAATAINDIGQVAGVLEQEEE